MSLGCVFSLPSLRPVVVRGSRVGMSMVEVMVTATILTIAIGSLMSLFAQQYQSRRSIDDQRTATTLVQSIATKLQSARWDYLGKPLINMDWSFGRYQDPDPTHLTHPPLTWDATDPHDNLHDQGLADVDPNLKDLKIYIEWYRGIDATDGSGLPVPGELGLLSQPGTTSKAFRLNAFVTGSTTRIKDLYWLTYLGAPWIPTSTTRPTECVGTDPLAIRIVATWTSKDMGPRQIELFTARSP